MKLLWMVAGLALATSGVVSAKDNDDEEEVAAQDKVICKTKKVTGSRTKVSRTCMTKAEWDATAAAARQGVDKLSRDASMNQSNGSGN
jgi:hypothetical protein